MLRQWLVKLKWETNRKQEKLEIFFQTRLILRPCEQNAGFAIS